MYMYIGVEETAARGRTERSSLAGETGWEGERKRKVLLNLK